MFPIGGITCITGVSGSGKSTLVTALAESLDKNTARKYGEIYDGESIKRIIKVNQSPIGKTLVQRLCHIWGFSMKSGCYFRKLVWLKN